MLVRYIDATKDSVALTHPKQHYRLLPRPKMIVAVLLVCATIIIIAFVYDYYLHHSRCGKLIDQIPGPKFIPIFGNILEYQVSDGK